MCPTLFSVACVKLFAKDVPDVAFGIWSGNVYLPVAYGVLETDAPGVQANRASWVAARCAVFQVALDAAADGCQLAAYLVVASRVEIYLQECISVAFAYGSIVQHGKFRSRLFSLEGVRFVLLLVARKVVAQFCGRLLRRRAYYGVVSFLYTPLAKHLVQPFQSLARTCKDADAADGSVQTVWYAQEDCSGFGACLLYIGFHLVAQRAVAGLVALDDFTGSLVHDYNVVVLVEYVHNIL